MRRVTAPVPTSKEAIGERLRITRIACGYRSQAAFCRITGIPTNDWNQYEKGRIRITPDRAIEVCRVTGVTLDWIYRGVVTLLPSEIARKIEAGVPEKPKRRA